MTCSIDPSFVSFPPAMTESTSSSVATDELLRVLNEAKGEKKRPRIKDKDTTDTEELLRIFKRAKLTTRLASPAVEQNGM